MLQTILIGPEGPLTEELANALSGVADVEIARILSSSATPEDVLRAIRTHKPDFLFVCMDELSHVELLMTRLDDIMPGLLLIGVGGQLEPDTMRKLMHIGVREYLPSPIEPAQLKEVIESTKKCLQRHPPPAARLADLCTFLPAKPGVGTSTIAASTSCALANDLGVRTLLLDCDLEAGTTKFLLKLGNTASLVDALGHASKLDEDLLSQMVGKWEKLEVLHAGGLNPPPTIDLPSLQRVLAMARSQYEVICADLPSNLNEFSTTLMRESRWILLVTTPEVVPLHLVRERVLRLGELGLSDRVRLLVNRKHSGKPTFEDEEVAKILGIPVSFSFPNDYGEVQSSILNASPIQHGSDLGESISALARSLTTHPTGDERAARRKFLEFFHVHKAEEPDLVWHN